MLKPVAQNDSLKRICRSQLKASERQKQRINMIKIYKITTNRNLLNPYVTELSAIHLIIKEINEEQMKSYVLYTISTTCYNRRCKKQKCK